MLRAFQKRLTDTWTAIPGKRRRLLLCALAITVLSVLGWHLLQQDPRFVGTWTLLDGTNTAESDVVFYSTGLVSFTAVSGRKQSTWTTWSYDDGTLMFGKVERHSEALEWLERQIRIRFRTNVVWRTDPYFVKEIREDAIVIRERRPGAGKDPGRHTLVRQME